MQTSVPKFKVTPREIGTRDGGRKEAWLLLSGDQVKDSIQSHGSNILQHVPTANSPQCCGADRDKPYPALVRSPWVFCVGRCGWHINLYSCAYIYVGGCLYIHGHMCLEGRG